MSQRRASGKKGRILIRFADRTGMREAKQRRSIHHYDRSPSTQASHNVMRANSARLSS